MLQTWTDKRDTILNEIRKYSIELEGLQKSTKEQGLAFADLEKSIAEAKGTLAEIEALETRMRGSLSTDIAELEVRKTRLEGQCVLMEQKLKGGDERFATCSIAIDTLQGAHATMKDQAEIVNKVVGEIIQTSEVHTSDMKTIMSEIRTIAAEVIEKGNENVKQTNIVLEKMPKFIFDMQRPIPVRRTYPVGHPNHEVSKE